jgi:hypothetical protein
MNFHEKAIHSTMAISNIQAVNKKATKAQSTSEDVGKNG